MKKITIFAICLGLASLYLDTAESMKKETTKTSKKDEVETPKEPQITLNLETPADPFVLANWMEENQEALLQNERAMTILQAYIRETLLTNLGYINSEYVNNVKQALDKIIRTLSRKNEKFAQLKALSNDLGEVLRLKKSLLRALNAEKRNFKHPFIDKNDPLMKGVLYMLQYVDAERLKEEIAASCEKMIPHITDKTNKRKIKQILQDLSDLQEKIESILQQMDTLEKATESDTDILDKKFPQLSNLSKAATS